MTYAEAYGQMIGLGEVETVTDAESGSVDVVGVVIGASGDSGWLVAYERDDTTTVWEAVTGSNDYDDDTVVAPTWTGTRAALITKRGLDPAMTVDVRFAVAFATAATQTLEVLT